MRVLEFQVIVDEFVELTKRVYDCKGFVNIRYYNYLFYSEFPSKLDPLSGFPLNGFSLDFHFVTKIFVMIILF